MYHLRTSNIGAIHEIKSILRAFVWLILLLTQEHAWSADASVQDAAERTMATYGESIYKLRIVNIKSGDMSAYGTGFFIGEGDVLATNYHVASLVVLEPENYRAVIDVEDEERQLHILAVDVVHDLALLHIDASFPALELSQDAPSKGAKLYSIGNPHSLGMTVVEGNYNGLIENRFLDKIHFSGALNSGMSGGPALSATGKVVGVNVATSGNQIGFLVPVQKLDALFKRAQKLLPSLASAAEDIGTSDDLEITGTSTETDVINDQESDQDNIEEEGGNSSQLVVDDSTTKPSFYPTKKSLQLSMGKQIAKATNEMLNLLMAEDWPLEDVAEAKVIGQMHSNMECWGNSKDNEKRQSSYIRKGCNNSIQIYVNNRFEVGFIEYESWVMEADDWPTSAFYRRLSNMFHDFRFGNRASKDDVENAKCKSEVVDRESGDFKRNIAFCARAYKEYSSLYDVFFVSMSLDRKNQALFEHFTLSAVSKVDAEAFLARFVGQAGWQ